jgi:hypothetical protein
MPSDDFRGVKFRPAQLDAFVAVERGSHSRRSSALSSPIDTPRTSETHGQLIADVSEKMCLSQEEKMLQATLDRRESLAVERWVDEQMFEEDVRTVLQMMRPHRHERLMGWKEYRTGGANFRVTVSWNSDFEQAPPKPSQSRALAMESSSPSTPTRTQASALMTTATTTANTPPRKHPLHVPNIVDVIEAFLIGSARDQDEITAQEEFGHYRAVVAELARRIDEMEACYT